MAEHKTLQKALSQMAQGSKSGFHTFYMGSVQYIYSSAMLLYDSHEDACRFMVDFYQYLYLHLPEYDRSQNLEKWISRLLVERYEQLSIGKNMPKPSERQSTNPSNIALEKSERERVWRMLDVNIHFPKESVHHHSRSRIALIVSLFFLLLILAIRYAPKLATGLQTVLSGLSASESDSKDALEEDTPSSEDNEDAPSEADEPDELEELLETLPTNTNEDDDASGNASDDSWITQQQQSTPSDANKQTTTKEPSAPREPDAPQQPTTPTAPQKPSLPENSDALSGVDELKNLELELYYGDSLKFADDD